MKWCCVVFEGCYKESEVKGFSIIIDEDANEGTPFFILQHRSVEPDAVIPDDIEIPFAMVSKVHIHYCPWCGACLKKKYNKSYKKLINNEFRMKQ